MKINLLILVLALTSFSGMAAEDEIDSAFASEMKHLNLSIPKDVFKDILNAFEFSSNA